MKRIHVHSLPLKEVIADLAKGMDSEFKQDCDLYELELPLTYGSGCIRGMDFNGGVGIIIYECEFTSDTEICFTVGDIHPAKFIYVLQGELEHRFENDEKIHFLRQHQSAMISSSGHNGHILKFKKNKPLKIYSVETDREVFIGQMHCEMDGVKNPLKELFLDTEAKNAFYYEGSYNLKLFDRLREIDESQSTGFTRKMFWFSAALGILAEQLVSYDSEIETDPKQLKLMERDVALVKSALKLIEKNLASPVNINVLANEVNTYPPKLQEAFRFVYGATVNKYITKLRVKKAAELLINSSFTITDIVSEVGLVNRGYFAKIFRQQFNCTPQEYRQNYKRLNLEREGGPIS